MKKHKLTEKKMKNKTFRSYERTILLAYFKLRDYPNAKKLAKRAKISRQAFYNHHFSPQMIPYDYEEYLLEIFKKKMKRFLVKQEYELKRIFLMMLIFIHGNREIFGVLLRDGRKGVIDEMAMCLKARILREWNLAGNLELLYLVYVKEVSGVIENWAKNRFNEGELDKMLSDIIYLTKTATRRLASFIE